MQNVPQTSHGSIAPVHNRNLAAYFQAEEETT